MNATRRAIVLSCRRAALCAVALLLACAAALPPALAQSAAKPVRVGILDAGERLEWWDAFRKQMRGLGYVEGRTVVYEQRFAKGKLDALPALAKELVAKQVAVIVAGGAAAAVDARRATSRIPIVIASGTDYVSLGLVSSLAHPGGNVTGLASINSELMVKRLELLRELVPGRSHVGVLWHADNAPSMASVRDLEVAAGKERLAFNSYGIRSEDEIAEAFDAMARDRVDALLVVNGPYIYMVRKKIAELARKSRIPAMYGAAEYVDAGGLVGYAPSYPDMYRNAAVYVDKILKGADPATMPIAQPREFELVLNAAAAKAIGIATARDAGAGHPRNPVTRRDRGMMAVPATEETAMAVYMVERSLPGITMEQLGAAQKAAIDTGKKFTAAGKPVRYIRSMYVPSEAHCMCLFEAPNADLVKQVNDEAKIPYTRIIEAADLTP